jgi:hypothetical protein
MSRAFDDAHSQFDHVDAFASRRLRGRHGGRVVATTVRYPDLRIIVDHMGGPVARGVRLHAIEYRDNELLLAGDHGPAIIDGRPKRRRKPSLTAALKAAKKAGGTATVAPDGNVTVRFDEAAKKEAETAVTVTPLEQWRAKRRGKG